MSRIWYDEGSIDTCSDEEAIDGILADARNVELPVSWLAGSNEVATEPEVDMEYGLDLMLYLVGEELGDDGSTSGAEAEAGTVVLTVVCSALPEEVVEGVLLRLPAAAQARCRAVCKAWLALLTNPEFLRRSFLQALSRTTPPPLCAVRHCLSCSEVPLKELRGPPLYKSLKVDLAFLPKVFHSRDSWFHNFSPDGLMCISRPGREGTHFCVFNPVNQSFKVLPMLPKRTANAAVLLVGTVSATESIPSFKVFVPEVEPVPESQLPGFRDNWLKDNAIYSSISGEWKGFRGQDMTYRSLAVACNGGLYATVCIIPPRLVRLSTERGPAFLRNLPLPGFKNFRRAENPREWEWTQWYLAGHRGKLLCCCNGIWMLDDTRNLWVEITGRCPPDILPPADPETQILMLHNLHVAGDLVVFFHRLHFLSGGHRGGLCWLRHASTFMAKGSPDFRSSSWHCPAYAQFEALSSSPLEQAFQTVGSPFFMRSRRNGTCRNP